MIIRMSKIQIIGPKDLLRPVLESIHRAGVFQIESRLERDAVTAGEECLKTLEEEPETVSERLYYQDLLERFDQLLACLPQVTPRETYLDPAASLEPLSKLLERHTEGCRKLAEQRQDLLDQKRRLENYAEFLECVLPMIGEFPGGPNLEFLGVELPGDPELEQLRKALERLTEGRYELQIHRREKGPVIALVAVERSLIDRLRKSLAGERIPELSPPLDLEQVPLSSRQAALRKHLHALEEQTVSVDRERLLFATRWGGLYRRAHAWVAGQLEMLSTSAFLYQTGLCFLVCGWVPQKGLESLRQRLEKEFSGEVLIEELEIREEEMDRVPVALRNPGYFKPFELLTGLLPLPKYSSVDPTPLIAIFFPIFFGMILGDLGYGLILLLAALSGVALSRARRKLRDASKILGVCAVYTAIFGWLYGELFGDLGRRWLDLHPVLFEREKAIVPMFVFALSVGVFHVLLGLLLGTVNALRRRLTKEALYKLLSILVILCLLVYLIGHFLPMEAGLRQALLLTVAVATPMLLFTGGLLAPLEMLKNFGNIISYARIMAIGLTSVLLAYVANNLAGAAGSVATGIAVAVLLHGFNLLLGVFAPAVHSLRLHYVEFFSKFFEPGGRTYDPLKRK